MTRYLKYHIIHIGTNRYIEGAIIFDRTHMLTQEEYFAGMRYNVKDCLARMTDAQLYEVKLGNEHDLDYYSLMRPELSPEEIRKLRTELETEATRKADPDHLYEATDYGPEKLCPGFLSVSNFEKYPDRVCYIPENWDFDDYLPDCKSRSSANADKQEKQLDFRFR